MEYRQLGRSGLLVSELALGTMVFGEEKARAASPEDATAMVHRFLDAGGNHIDTADVYSAGESEEIAYTELVEYLRFAAQLTYEELAELRAPADGGDEDREAPEVLH